AERDAVDCVRVWQGVDQSGHTGCSPRIEVPYLHGLVPARRGKQPPVGAEGHTAHMILVGRERKPLLADGRVPNLDDPILTARGDPPAVGAKYRAEHGGSMV